MKATSVQKTLVLLAVLAALVIACSCKKLEDKYDVSYYSEADGYDASSLAEEADTDRSSSEDSDTYSSNGQSYDEGEHDDNAYEEETPAMRVPVARQLKKLVPGVKGGVNQKKCNDECAKLQDQTHRLCCPLWCRYNSDKAKEIKSKGRDATVVKEASWKSVEKVNKGEVDLSNPHANLFIKFTKSPACVDYLNNKQLPAVPVKDLPQKPGRPLARRPRVKPRKPVT